jgi:hypothetical protein
VGDHRFSMENKKVGLLRYKAHLEKVNFSKIVILGEKCLEKHIFYLYISFPQF